MQKTVKVTVAAISTTAVIIMSLYFAGLNVTNNATRLSPECFSIYRYYVATGPYAGLGVIRLEYVGSETMQGNLTIQAKYKDTGELVSGESSRVGIEPKWRTEIPVYRPSDARVIITITYDGESIVLTA